MLARPDVGHEGSASRHIVVERREHVDGRIEAIGQVPLAGSDERVAAGEVVVVDTGEVDRDTGAGTDLVDGSTSGLERTDPRPAITGDDVLVGRQPSTGQRSGDDGAAALRREHPVDPQPGTSPVARPCRARHECVEFATKLVEARTRGRRDRHDGCIGQEGADEVIGDVHVGQLEQLGVDQIRLGEHDDARLDAEQFENPEVLLRLRLPPLGGGHDEHTGRDTTDPGEHVAEELHVTGHVDEAEFLTGRQRRVCEAEIDGEPAALLLRQTVRVGAGECEHERRLAVVDVTRRRDDGHVTGRRAFSAAMIVVSSAGSTDRRSSIVWPSRERAITGRSWRRSASRRSPSSSRP